MLLANMTLRGSGSASYNPVFCVGFCVSLLPCIEADPIRLRRLSSTGCGGWGTLPRCSIIATINARRGDVGSHPKDPARPPFNEVR